MIKALGRSLSKIINATVQVFDRIQSTIRNFLKSIKVAHADDFFLQQAREHAMHMTSGRYY